MKRYILGYYCTNATDLQIINKDSNREILRALRKEYPGGLTVAEIAKETGRPEKTVYAQVNELYTSYFISELEKKPKPKERGRPSSKRPELKEGRASRFVLEDMNRFFNGANEFNYQYAPGSVDYQRGFLDTWHKIVTDEEEEEDELCRSLMSFVEKVLRRITESDDRKISKWAPSIGLKFCCSQCGLNHEVRDFVRATLLHLVDHYELTTQFYEFLNKNESIDEETYKKVTEALKKEETEEEEELEEDEEEF